MTILLISIFFIIKVIFIILPVTIIVEYRRVGQNDKFYVDIYTIIKMLGITIKIPYLQNKLRNFIVDFFAEIDMVIMNIWPWHEEIDFEKEIDLKKIQLDKIKKIFKLLLNKRIVDIIVETLNIKCTRLYWATEFGFSNPAFTGISTGFLWILKGLFLKSLNSILFSLRQPEISIQPDFENKRFDTEFKGIFSIRLGNIILIIIKFLLYKVKGGYGLWKNIQLKN